LDAIKKKIEEEKKHEFEVLKSQKLVDKNKKI